MIQKIKSDQKAEFILDRSISFRKLNSLKLKNYKNIFLFIDKNFYTHYPKFINKIKKENNNTLEKIIFSNEKLKELSKFNNIINYLIKNNCSKEHLILVVGSGTMIDLFGFTSSVFMRGINLILIPTNLISMADAATAGKTCINIKSYKNLVGTVYMPKRVYININFLKSCNNTSNRQGWAEIFKYGLLGSIKLILLIEKYFKKKNDDLILKIKRETIKIRLKIMNINPLASNLGHTFGHAIEKLTNNKVQHGDAVSIGTILALKFAMTQNLIKKKRVEIIIRLMNFIGLKTNYKKKINVQKMINYMLKDKKSVGNNIGLILIKDVGKPYMKKSKPFYYCDKNKMLSFLVKEI